MVTGTMQIILMDLKYLISEITEQSHKIPGEGIALAVCMLPLNFFIFLGRRQHLLPPWTMSKAGHKGVLGAETAVDLPSREAVSPCWETWRAKESRQS